MNLRCINLTVQTDVSQTYRTFFLKIKSCLHFLKSLKYDNVLKMGSYGQISSHTEF